MQYLVVRALIAVGFSVVVCVGAGCAPEPRSLPCTNDGQCRQHDERLNYCTESRCVECVGVASCPAGKTCDDGVCVECVDDRGCAAGAQCVEGVCQAR